jgi:hypothetical protein
METVTEFIIDLSGSMKDKIALTKQMLLSDIIPNLDYSSRIGIKSFSAVKDMPPVVQELPLAIIDKEGITKTITGLTVKQGGTPISEAIRQSVNTLKEYPVNKKKIILVTDGEEDKNGDYIAECRKASIDGINCEIHVIGIGLNQQAQKKAIEISKHTNGTYSNIAFSQGTQYNQSLIKNSLTNFYSATNNYTFIQLEKNNQLAEKEKQKRLEKNRRLMEALKATEAPVVVNTQTEDSEDEDVFEKNLEEEVEDSVETNSLLKMLVDEIKEIRQEIKKIKAEKEVIPEIVEDSEINEKIRSISESYLFEVLKLKYPNRVKWLNEKGESNFNHDFEILEEDGNIEYYIECKGTAKMKTTFYVTKNEWKLFLNNTKNYQIYFIQNVLEKPSHIFISNLLDWILRGKLYPFLKTRETIKEERVFFTIDDSHFVK